MATKPEGERIASLEATMTSLEKKVDEGFSAISRQLTDMSAGITARNAIVDDRFVHKEDFDKRLTSVEKQLGTRWINNTLSAIFGAVLTGLVGALFYFITRG